MIHGRDADAVDEKIDELAADHLPFDHERLYSTAKLKQTGADTTTSSARTDSISVSPGDGDRAPSCNSAVNMLANDKGSASDNPRCRRRASGGDVYADQLGDVHSRSAYCGEAALSSRTPRRRCPSDRRMPDLSGDEVLSASVEALDTRVAW